MPGRQVTAANQYRYGFNGKEQDNDMNGSGVAYDYEFRIYNARIGKFLSTDPLTKSYPFYTPYQFAGNKPTIAIDIDGLEEWVAIYAHGTDNEPSTFRFAPELKSLGAGQIYKRILDDRNDETNLTVYNVNKQKTVNIAFILNEALVEEDINKHGIAAFSSYSIDASFFKSLKPRTPGVNYAPIECGSVQDMVFKGVTYLMKNSETLKDAVIDFEGTNHLKQRKHGELHRLFIGRDKLRVDANGKSVDFTEETHHLFQLFGKFTAGGSQVLLGACNANKCISVVAQTSKDMNAVIYGHNSYSYSMSLNTGRFYGGWWNQYPSVVDGNQGGLGHYFRIGPDGKINFDVGGVKFLASPTQNGMADLKISPDPEYPPKKQ